VQAGKIEKAKGQQMLPLVVSRLVISSLLGSPLLAVA
jgi:hypothetical protein